MADDFLERIRQARTDAANMEPAEARQYIGTLLGVANTLDMQANQIESYLTQKSDRVATRYGADAGDRVAQTDIANETIASARAEAAAIRALVEEIEPQTISEGAQSRIWGDGYDASDRHHQQLASTTTSTSEADDFD